MPIEPHQRRHQRQRRAPDAADSVESARAVATALAYSSAVTAGVAGAMVSSVSLAFGLEVGAAVVVLAASGTLIVYNVDRLRDLERDKLLAPARSRFVARNRSLLVGLAGAAAVASVASAIALPSSTWILCAVVLALGLLHRRLKRVRGIKTLYLTGSWLAVTIGLPLAAAPAMRRPSFETLYWVSSVIGCAILANLMASNLDRRRAEENPRNIGARRKLNPAIAVAGLGLGLAIVGPEAVRGLALIPGAEFVALARYRDDEGYAVVVLDGALLVGACGAIAFFVFGASG